MHWEIFEEYTLLVLLLASLNLPLSPSIFYIKSFDVLGKLVDKMPTTDTQYIGGLVSLTWFWFKPSSQESQSVPRKNTTLEIIFYVSPTIVAYIYSFWLVMSLAHSILRHIQAIEIIPDED